MKVRMKQQLLGLVYGQVAPAVGETMTIPDDDEAARYCQLGYCEPVAEKPAERAEKAVPKQAEEQRSEKSGGKRRADAG